MKSIKISPEVHKELKMYVAKTGENISDFSGLAIMQSLKNNGHKFSKPEKNKKK
jgi:hypothetical protein